jgi:hypothetical protein
MRRFRVSANWMFLRRRSAVLSDFIVGGTGVSPVRDARVVRHRRDACATGSQAMRLPWCAARLAAMLFAALMMLPGCAGMPEWRHQQIRGLAGPEVAWGDIEEVGLMLPVGPASDKSAAWRVWEPMELEAFRELILSWNVRAPQTVGVWFEIRVADEPGGAWTPWMLIGEWGVLHPKPVTKADGMSVEVDVLVSQRPLRMVQVRAAAVAEWVGRGGGDVASVELQRLAMTTTRPARAGEAREAARREHGVGMRAESATAGQMHAEAASGAIAASGAGGAVYFDARRAGAARMPVPFRSQKTPEDALSGRLCSPTSVSMVLAYYGVGQTVHDVAGVARDPRHDIFGNWPRNVQTAFNFGVPGEVTRFDSWSEVEAMLDAGVPIIASIRVRPGELRNAPYESTGGHLIVLTGYDRERGVVFVNDPAAGDVTRGVLEFYREDLTRVWLSRGKGTAYVLRRP